MAAADPAADRRSALVRSFSTLDDALAAQDALAAAGIARELLELTVLEDEAGPVASNFLIGNGQTHHGGTPAPVRSGGEVAYDANFRATEYHGAYLLTLHQLGPTQRSVAQSVLAGFDSVAVTELARSGQGS
ncbi:hypothetical protein [Ramlibacter alkalitolerans]|uniref:Uncharacterized protein n=1 Tax=Ramlibacter alkalitolerans TaxID=2039631 RepID=A0ABS1JS44_9BURK|nr:hypothetical protein [Ramlibacter alkalitolerans]MBL0427079.1 hypothetical protein [Ramlibacter alkalitolerans]